jgi:hypothetical protein
MVGSFMCSIQQVLGATALLILIFENQGCEQASSGVTSEDYAVYSALIDSNLDYRVSHWNISGERILNLKNDNFEQININSQTISSSYLLLANRALMDVSAELYSDYKEKDEQTIELENKFQTNTKTFLFTKAMKSSVEAEARNTGDYGKTLKSKFPKETGWFGFSRVGFDKRKKQALVTARFQGYETREGYSPDGIPEALYLLIKENGRWIIKDAVTQDDELELDPSKCKPNQLG